MDRRTAMLGGVELAATRGLEIGPRNAPLVAKSDGDVRYVDYASVEEIRAAWDKPHLIDPATFVDVDLVWGETPLGELAGAPVDYIVASHVIEHVPDLAGWLGELHGALKPDGLLGLAVPDRRFTFDLFRPESSLAEVVEAHLLGYRRPSIRQIFDAHALSRPNVAAEAWTSDPKARLAPMREKYRKALALAEDLLARPRYIDTHCWVFTPCSFLDLCDGMAELGWFPYRIEALLPTERGELEFHVRLRRAAADDPAAIAASIAQARAALAQAEPAPEGMAR